MASNNSVTRFNRNSFSVLVDKALETAYIWGWIVVIALGILCQ